ncbi:MAG TPA: alpha/beta fold hydrolase [Gemmatimonadaceae bacterium]|jgi:pimeloyl-ACP methyl ester carboxylesterase
MSGSSRERVVRFGRDQSLMGILTTPREARPGAPYVVIINAGIVHRVGPNRIYVDVARTLAAQGFSVLRFDLSGLGDSEPMATAASLGDAAVADVRAAFDFLQTSRQATRFIISGLCLGANYSFLAALADDRVSGVMVLDPTVPRTARGRLVHLRRRVMHLATLREVVTLRHPVWRRGLERLRQVAVPEFALPWGDQRVGIEKLPERSVAQKALQELVDRHVQLMFVFTGGVNHVYNYRDQLFDLLPGLEFRKQLRLEYMPTTDHAVSDRASRTTLLEAIGDWATTTFPAGAVS